MEGSTHIPPFHEQMRLGREARERQEWAAALEHFGVAATIDPSRPGPRMESARTHLAMGELDKAEVEFQAMAAAPAGNVDAVLGLARVAMRRKQSPVAVRYFQRAVHDDPSSLPARLGLASAQAAADRLRESEESYRAILRRHPAHAPALLGLARLLRQQQRTAALQYFSQAAQADPQHHHTRLELAQTLVACDRTAEAAALFQQLLNHEETRLDAAVGLGDLAMQQDRPDIARGHFESALAHAPGNRKTLLRLAVAALSAGAPDRAKQFCRTLLDDDPLDPDALVILLKVAHGRETVMELLPLLERAAEAHPDHERLGIELSLIKGSGWREAIVEARRKMADAGASVGARLRAGLTLVQYGVVDGLEDRLRDLADRDARAARLLSTARQLRRSGMAQAAPGSDRADDAERDHLRGPSGIIEKIVPGQERLIVLFAGRDRGMLITFDLFHRLLRPMGTSALYVRDLEHCSYLGGIPGLGSSLSTSIAGMRGLIERAGARRVFMISYCGGAAGALRYGLEVGAEAVLAIAPRSRLLPVGVAPEVMAMVPKWREAEPRLSQHPRILYEAAARRPRLTLIYGEDCAADAADARDMKGIPGTTLIPVAGTFTHNCMKLLLGAGLFGPLVREFATEGSLSAGLIEQVRGAAERAPDPVAEAPAE